MKRKQRYFKGFDKDLKALHGNRQQYSIGGIFSAGNLKDEPRMCSNTVLHFCGTLSDCFNYYLPGGNTGHRYCEVAVIPGEPILTDGNKLGSPYLKILREIPSEVVLRYRRFCKYLEQRECIINNHKLPLVQELQKRYPELILCGSAAVFLHTGKVYERNKNSSVHDLDFVTPYYIRIEGDPEEKLAKTYETFDFFDSEGVETAKANTLKVSSRDKWGSGNDFDEVVHVNNVPVDIAVNPHNKYEYITFRGFRYKVATLASILEHKLKYANQGNGKHMQDISDLINLPATFKIKGEGNNG